MEKIYENLTTDQAAAQLGVTGRTLRKYAQAGKIERFTENGKVLYKVERCADAEGGPELSGPARNADRPIMAHSVTSVNEVRTDTEVTLRDMAQAKAELARKFEADLVRERKESLTEIIRERQERKSQVFSLRMLAGTVCLVAAVLGGIVCIGWGTYKGQIGEMSALRANAATAEKNLTTEQGRGVELKTELTQAQKETQRLAAEKAELQKAHQQALNDLIKEINKPAPAKPDTWYDKFLKAGSE